MNISKPYGLTESKLQDVLEKIVFPYRLVADRIEKAKFLGYEVVQKSGGTKVGTVKVLKSIIRIQISYNTGRHRIAWFVEIPR